MKHDPLLERFPLLPGNHPTRAHGMCAMELVAWLAGEQHSDQPQCACSVLTALVRTFNDIVPTREGRDRYVRPLTPRLVNSTVATEAQREARAMQGVDAAVRFFAPLSLARNGGDFERAEQLRNLPELKTRADAAAAAELLSTFGTRAVFAAHWTAARAGQGQAVRLWISGVAHAAKATQCWQGLRRVIESMLEVPTTALRASQHNPNARLPRR